jgi:hypothetical protein
MQPPEELDFSNISYLTANVLLLSRKHFLRFIRTMYDHQYVSSYPVQDSYDLIALQSLFHLPADKNPHQQEHHVVHEPRNSL